MAPKSGFSRTRNVDYDDDDAYDDEDEYYEEAEGGDGMTAEDREQMRVGTIRVKEALGETSGFISDAQIHEALWHYYYDIEKSVIYLKNKLGTTQPKQGTPKKEKATSRFDQAASVADQKAPTTTGKQNYAQYSYMEESACTVAPSLVCLPPFPISTTDAASHDFFWDMPWGNVPSDRLGTITTMTPSYRGGLLGGSSKLAALAAKRRKEREEAEAAATKVDIVADSAIAMLDKLTVKNKEAPSLHGDDNKPERPPRVSRYPVRKRSPSPSQQAEAPKEDLQEPESSQPAIVVEIPAQRATASMFASTLCGPDRVSRQASPELREFLAPYAQHKDYDSAKAFAGPSPDDIVRAAQAKGAGGGRR